MALDYVAPGQRWATGIVALGSVIAHTAVLLVFQLGQPRIFFSMARDGLLPPVVRHASTRSTARRTSPPSSPASWWAVFAAFASIDEMVDLTNIGTLFAFVLVCVGIPILRYTNPDRARPFRVPFGPYLLPLLGAASCIFLMFYLPPASWWRFIGWLVLGFAIYSSYGYTRSVIGRRDGPAGAHAVDPEGGLPGLPARGRRGSSPSRTTPGSARSSPRRGTRPAPTIGRSLFGLSLIVVGLVLGIAGLLLETGDRRAA